MRISDWSSDVCSSDLRKSLLLLSATRKFETTDKGQITRGSSSISRVSATTNPQTIDTAWVNMAVGSSYWSNRLKNNAEEYDSVKIMHYIEKYEKLYEDDPVFIKNALNALQQRSEEHKSKIQ